MALHGVLRIEKYSNWIYKFLRLREGLIIIIILGRRTTSLNHSNFDIVVFEKFFELVLNFGVMKVKPCTPEIVCDSAALWKVLLQLRSMWGKYLQLLLIIIRVRAAKKIKWIFCHLSNSCIFMIIVVFGYLASILGSS